MTAFIGQGLFGVLYKFRHSETKIVRLLRISLTVQAILTIEFSFENR